MLQISSLVLAGLLLQTPSLDSSNPRERLDAVEQLSIVGRTGNVPRLAEALKKEPRSDVRAAIVAGLGRIGGQEVIPVLAQTLDSDLDKDVRLQAIDSFQRLYIPIEEKGALSTIFNKVKSAFAEDNRPLVHDPRAVDPAATAALAESMQTDFVEEVRAASARALGSLRAQDRVAVLVATLESPQNRESPAVRREIAESLGFIRDPAAGPALLRAVRDNDRRTSQNAILAIGLIGYQEGRPTLENVFQSERNTESKKRALEAIALMRDPAAKPFLESLIEHKDDGYRELAAEGLGRIGYDPKLLKARYDIETKANVHYALAFALVAADQDQYFNELAGGLTGRQAYQAEAYIYELGKYEGKMSEVHRYLRSTDARIRARMARIVGDIADPSSRPLIEELTRDKDPEVASEAIMALRKLTPA